MGARLTDNCNSASGADSRSVLGALTRSEGDIIVGLLEGGVVGRQPGLPPLQHVELGVEGELSRHRVTHLLKPDGTGTLSADGT